MIAMIKKPRAPNWAIRPLVSEEVYTDRQEFLDYFYRAALNARERRTMSTVLLGRRRMGKTEIFKRVVNRLFFEQDHRDPEAVVPVYYSFPDKAKDDAEFALRYAENFLRWQVAFRLRDTKILSTEICKRSQLLETIRDSSLFSETFKASLELIEGILEEDVIAPEEKALWLPRRISDYDDVTTVMFLDEFQNTRLPQYDFDIVGYMQEAVESPTCPHFVTGSAMTILVREILGRGALFGRFDSDPIEPLTGYWGAELARRSAQYHRASVSEEIAPVLAERCGGNPFYIDAVAKQSAKQGRAIATEEDLNEILAVDLSSGFIWAELADQVEKWIARINEHGITKWVLYLSALEEGEELDLDHIRTLLWEKDRTDVSREKIFEVLVKLSRGDLIEYMSFGGWFKKVDDPILVEFLKVWGRIEVERQHTGKVRDKLLLEYRRMKRQFAELTGYLAEVYMAQILLSSQRKTLPGKYFHQENNVEIPRFTYLNLRERFGIGPDREVDIHGAAGLEHWVAESKWQRDRLVGIPPIEKLLEKAAMVKKECDPDFARAWFFSHGGFTEEAERFMVEKGILWSTREDLDGLLDHVGLRRLPSLSAPPEADEKNDR
uniref:ATPase n=1 Tax=Candidatus Kentrum sp. LPFa TaxID=2126335 RepID=A0A450W478_9GAMM|nr:MAG: ATPase [Candidatus Kentron sp. LPFa]